MKKKVIKIVIPLLFVAIIGTSSLAISKKILINDETFSFINKEEKILSNFDSKYNISYNDNTTNDELKKTITELTKKTTYLLLGEPNLQNEKSENYYKRYHDYLDLRYNPEIPKDENATLGLDANSQEYKDDILSGISVPGMFLKLNELKIQFNTYGTIRVTPLDENRVLSVINLSNINMKEQDSNDPMKYNTVQTDLKMYYIFKKLNDEYKLLYLYGETNGDIEDYINNNDEKSGSLTQNSDYNSKLRDIYNFDKADAITDDLLNKIYEENKSKIVYLNSTYNLGTVASANGFFINEGLIMTTYKYIEKSLMNAQNITINDSLGNIYQLDGIVTMNIENDIAILKVKNKNQNYINFEEIDTLKKEDAVISLNSKTGVGLVTSKGIIISPDKDIQVSLPIEEEQQGSPLFNSEGKLIGMINLKTVNSSVSFATHVNILKNYYNKLSEINYDEIKAISFEELKENYYIKYSEETTVNNIPQNKWKKYSYAENIEDFIDLKLVKGSYKDGIISLRYKNDIKDFIDTMQFATKYIENLKDKGYEEKYLSDSKVIYENKKYKIIIMKEFDYLIVVMVRL